MDQLESKARHEQIIQVPFCVEGRFVLRRFSSKEDADAAIAAFRLTGKFPEGAEGAR